LRREQRQDWRAKLEAWLPVALWAALIFFFSTDAGSMENTGGILASLLSALYPDLTADQLNSIHFVTRKLAHWTEYFVFSLLIVRALQRSSHSQPQPVARHIGLTLAIVILYAAGDEWHQGFVPSRTGSPADVVIDSFGGICGVLWTRFQAIRTSSRRRRIKNLTS
jgi:VanZ family protein